MRRLHALLIVGCTLSGCGVSGEVLSVAAPAPVEAGTDSGDGGSSVDAGSDCALEVPDGAVVHYVVTQDGNEVLEGDIVVDDPAETVTVLVGGLPPGEHDITFIAGGAPCMSCSGDAPFAVETGQATSVGVNLVCRDEDDDGVLISGGSPPSCDLDVLRFYTALPRATGLQSAIALTAGADDVNGQQPEFEWSASAGSISGASGPMATFSCDGVAGKPMISLTLRAQVEGALCEQRTSFEVECVANCGNGIIDPGETCDTADPATSDCPPDCTMPACGDGVVESLETCEPPGTGDCDATCHGLDASCGNGVVEPGEECEPPATSDCALDCRVP
jgi:hypothetical protein